MTVTYGYKSHANVDEDGFVRAMEMTAGNIHDSQVFTELLSGDDLHGKQHQERCIVTEENERIAGKLRRFE